VKRPTRAARTGAALAIAGCVFAVILAKYRTYPAALGYDFTYQWRAARALLDGQNPYKVMVVSGRFPFNWPYFYPLPSAFFAVPFAIVDARLGAALYLAMSTALLAYALSADNWWRLAVLLSAPFMSAMLNGQASPLLTASYLAPPLSIVAWHKPNLGLAIFAAHPRRLTVVWGVVLAMVAFLIVPQWPLQWLRVVNSAPEFHVAPIFVPGGVVLLSALVRWRRPEARLLTALACIPHSMTFYDPLPLLLVPRSFRSLLLLALASHGSLWAARWWNTMHHLEGGALFLANAPFALWGIYFPALVMILLRPNEGGVPQWLDSRLGRLPCWLRGTQRPQHDVVH
jgi:hypothetical protein